MHDFVIRGGTVVDGTGAPARTADVAIDDGVVVEVGRVDGRARRELDADGLLVTPGFVDVHTHFDGQATWDPHLTPSCWHGVTTAVLGNCGVGFAPVRPDAHEHLVELMEGVEDIPGTALHEGIQWDWESFPEYLDALERMPRAIDVGAQVPHAALRTYVMGEREHGDATADDVDAMRAILRRVDRRPVPSASRPGARTATAACTVSPSRAPSRRSRSSTRCRTRWTTPGGACSRSCPPGSAGSRAATPRGRWRPSSSG